jgi:DNA repair protein RadC
VFDYVQSLGDESCEWLCALYVDEGLNLLAIETMAVGGSESVRMDFGHILCRGRFHDAAGFILVHNHPSGDPTPSRTDKEATARLRYVSEQLEMPLLDHFIVAGDRMEPVGFW